MLARVAETLYWLARYVERAENTARLVNANARLTLDLPQGSGGVWSALVAITGQEEIFTECYGGYSKENVYRFLLGDRRNPSSIMSSLVAARENLRVTRDRVPKDAWEDFYALYRYATDTLSEPKRGAEQQAVLQEIIRRCQQFSGLLAGTMNHGVGYSFIRIGRHLERADMTLRIIDVRSANLLHGSVLNTAPYDGLQWISVLRSLSAFHGYRGTSVGPITGATVLEFLLQQASFPRSVVHCLGACQTSLCTLPANHGVLTRLATVRHRVASGDIQTLSNDTAALTSFIDLVEGDIGLLHQDIAETWFLAGVS